jgi:hypothetical protein
VNNDQAQVLNGLAKFQQWERDVRAAFARYQKQGKPVPPDELKRLLESMPDKDPA